MASMFDVYEEEPEILTPEEMRAKLRRTAEARPEDVYGCGCPKGHVTAVLAGREEPLPELLTLLELREERGSYASTREIEPEEPPSYAWPDGRPFTPKDERELRGCIREALGAGAKQDHDEFSYAVSWLLRDSEALPEPEDAESRGYSPAFHAGAAWAERRARRKAAEGGGAIRPGPLR